MRECGANMKNMSAKTAVGAIEARLNAFRQKSRIRAGSLIATVFGDAVLPRGGKIWIGSLIRLLQPLEVNERLIRTAVFRLVKEEWLQTEVLGRRTNYLLNPAGLRRVEEASRQIYSADAHQWDQRWRLVMVLGDVEPRQRERLRRALQWQGFGDLGGGCFIHPRTELSSAFDALVSEGLAELLPKLMPLVGVNPRLFQSANDADMVRNAWSLDSLAEDYGEFVTTYGPILDELRGRTGGRIDEETAFQARTLLIHDYRRLLLRDPELPEVLLPADWPGNEARRLCKDIYHRLLVPSERFLNQHLQLASGDVPRERGQVKRRFVVNI